MVLHMADAHGHPVAGEATVWMVDQAVLSLAKEAPLDPLPAFIVNRPSTMQARDTRNMAFGVIPLQETPPAATRTVTPAWRTFPSARTSRPCRCTNRG